MPPFKIEVKSWALHMGLAIVSRQAVDAGTEKEHGPWLTILKAADGMRPAESVDVKTRDQLMKLREAIDYALTLPGKPVDVAIDCHTCKYREVVPNAAPCNECNHLDRGRANSHWELK